MRLKIITHEKTVFDDEIEAVYITGLDGEYGILKDHVPFMTTLDIGVTRIVQSDKTQYFTVMGGVFQFKDEEALILTHISENADNIDEMRAKEALERAKARLNEIDDKIDTQRAQAAIARAMARLKVVASKQKG